MTLIVEVYASSRPPVVLEIAADATVSTGELTERLRHHFGLEGDGYALRIAPDSAQGVPGTLFASEASLHTSGLVSGMSLELVRTSGARPELRRSVPSSWELVAESEGVERVLALDVGLSSLGSSSTCRLPLEGGGVSSTHAYIEAGIDVWIHAAQGAVLGREGEGEAASIRLAPGSYAQVGPWRVRARHRPGAEVVVDDAPARAYLPPSRIELTQAEVEIALPRVPRRGSSPPVPFVSLFLPLMLAGVMYALTRSTFVIIFAIAMPAMALAHYWSQRARVHREWAVAVREFDAALDEARAEVHGVHETEKARLEAMLPSARGILQWDSPKTGDLWALRDEHSDFMVLRLGTGRISSSVSFKGEAGAEGPRDLRGELDMLREQGSTVIAPVTISLREIRGLGITGEGRMSLARALAVQLGGRHSPSDVRFALVSSPAANASARNLAWLPHVRRVGAGGVLVLETDESVAEWAARRMPGAVEETTEANVVVIAFEPTTAQLTSLAVLAEAWEAHGETGPRLIVTSGDSSHVPGVCAALVETTASGAVLWHRGRTAPVTLESLEGMGEQAILPWARRLAPLVDARKREGGSEAIPASVSLLEVNGTERRHIRDRIARAWHVSDHAQTLTLDALVGYGETGPLTIPLRTWGPHALVAGTTGSGKSEFLQSWVLGLALRYSPRRLTFLFVDYKGGAALGECARLPHCTGLVTDLSPGLVTRALTSLKAELRYREELLARIGAKDSDEYADSGGTDLPAFVIVVDEFAALRDNYPEFLDGLIDIAQRGRSLGIHLILATQRPAGIVSERLRANVSLRIALRLSDAADSIDVIGSKAAAQISLDTPGRAVVSAVGAGLQHEVQMAYSGSRGESDRSSRLAVTPVPAMNIEGVPRDWDAEPKRSTATLTRGHTRERTEARLIVDEAIGEWSRTGARVRSPWLPPLEENYAGEGLAKEWGFPAPFALLDDPARQRRAVARVGEPGSVYGVYGASGTGRSTSIVSIVRSTRTVEDRPRVFVIDSASRGLNVLIDESHAVAYVRGDDTASVLRMLRHLARTETASRASILVIDSFADLCHEAHPSDREDMLSLLGALARTARARKLTLVIGATGPSELPRSLETSCTERIIHRLSRSEDYALCGPAVRLTDAAPVGRASIGGLETHVALFDDPCARDERDRNACLEAFTLSRRLLDVREAREAVRDPRRGFVGFSHAEGTPVSLPLMTGGLVLGGAATERVALLESLAHLVNDREVLRVPARASSDAEHPRYLLERAKDMGAAAFVLLEDIKALESDGGGPELGSAIRGALGAGACIYGGLEGGSFSRLGSVGPALAQTGCGIVLGASETDVFTVFGRTPPRTRWASTPDVAWLVEGHECRLIVPSLVARSCAA